MNEKFVCVLKAETNYGSSVLKGTFHINRNGVFRQIVLAYLGLMIHFASVLCLFY